MWPWTLILGELLCRRKRASLRVGPLERPLRARAPLASSDCGAGPEIPCVTWPTLMAYLRTATCPRIFAAPLNPDEALDNVAAVVNLPCASSRSRTVSWKA